MSKGRMEAFSDGVIAIIITIMVLQLPLPSGDGAGALKPLVPVFFTYLLSYVWVAASHAISTLDAKAVSRSYEFKGRDLFTVSD